MAQDPLSSVQLPDPVSIWRGRGRVLLRRLIGPLLTGLVFGAVSLWTQGVFWAMGWQEPHGVPTSGWGQLLAMGQWLVVGWALAQCWRGLTWQPSRPAPVQAMPKMARDLVALLMLCVFAGMGLHRVYGQSVETLLAASGVVSLILGYALRSLFSDVFSGIALHLDHNIRPGDWLGMTVKGKDMHLQLVAYDWRYTVLLDRYNNTILIPNGDFSSSTLTNLSRPQGHYHSDARLAVAVHHDHVRVCEALQMAGDHVASLGHVLKDPAPYVRVREIVKGLVYYEIEYSVAPGVNADRARHYALYHSLGFLKAAGIPLKDIIYDMIVTDQPALHTSDDLGLPEVRARILDQLPFFAALSQSERYRVATRARLRSLTAGETVIHEGDEGRSMFVVLRGRLEVLSAVEGRAGILATLWPGDPIGEMSLLTGQKRSATVRAGVHSGVLEIDHDTVSALFRDNPALMEALAQTVQERQAANRRKMDEWSRLPEPTRPMNLVQQIRAFFAQG